MSVTVNYSGNAAGLWTTYILRKFIPTLRQNTVVSQYCEPAMLPKGEGAAVARWNIMDKIVVDTTALVEASATDNEITEITVTSVESTIAEYGNWMKVSDLTEETVTSSALDAYADAFAYAGAQTIDTLLYNEAVTTTNFLHAGDTASGGATLLATNLLTAQDVAVAGSLLRSKYARGFDSLNGKYALLISPDQEQDLVTDVTTTRLSWSEVKKNVATAYENQIERKNNGDLVGSLGRVSVFLADVVGTVTEDVAAWRAIALARYGVGWLGLGENKPKPKIIMKRPGPQDTSNPLNQYMTIGWKVKMADKLLNANCVFVVYSAA
jgi:N4-gp56 family major capsid protein